MNIITNTKALVAKIAAFTKSYKALQETAHIVVVSAIWHAAKHGDVTNLNRVFEVLNSNDQQAVKMYVRRAQTYNGMAVDGDEKMALDGMPSEVLQQKLETGKILDFSKGAFTVTRGHTSKEAESLVKLCEERFIEPDGEIDRLVFERNNFAEQKTFGDAAVLEALEKQVKAALAPSNEKRVNALTDTTINFLKELQDKITYRRKAAAL